MKRFFAPTSKLHCEDKDFAYDCYLAVFAASGVQTDFFFSTGSSHDQIQGEIDSRMRLTTYADACVPRRLISHLLNQDLAARCIRLRCGNRENKVEMSPGR